ncbi:MAG TPA: GHKL domain-containing protein [Clostridiales bacterium]|nr:GHKL domain-containing protein [Clostridiales bacterium]
MLYHFVNEIFFATIEGIIILALFCIFTSRKDFFLENKAKSVLFVLLYTVFSFWASTYLPVGYHTILIAVFMVLSLALITSEGLISSLLACAIIMVFLVISEFILATVFLFLNDVKFAEIVNTPYLKLQFSIVVKLAESLVVLLFYRSKIFEKPIFKKLSGKESSSIYLYFFLGIFLMGHFVFSINYGFSKGAGLGEYQFLLCFLFFLFCVLGVFIYKEKQDLFHIRHKYQLQKEYIKNIETVIDIVRREKHDFINHINTVYAICMLNKPEATEKIKAYLDKLIDNLQSTYHFYNTGNEYIDGLLAVKSNYAFSHHIHFDVNFEELLDQVEIEDYDLISIVSNLIDNAFDAILSEPEHEGKIISVYGYTEEENYYLSVSNNGPVIPAELMDKIFEKGFSTKKDNKGEHGFGLHIIKQLVEKNGGKITVSSSEEETEFLIQIKRKKMEYGEVCTEDYPVNTAESSEV